jgi:sugar phosphate isomerase/epimerase
MQMEIACNTVAFRRESLDYALERIATAGYEFVEVEANLKWCPHADPWEDDPLEFKQKVADHGFKGVSAIGCHRELITYEQGVKDIAQALEWCHAAGVPVVLTGEGRLPPDMSVEQALDILKGRLEGLAEVAEKNQVYLALEDHGSISLTPDGLSRIINLVKNDWVGVNFDTANIHRGDYVGTDRGGYEWKLGAKTSYSEIELLNKVVSKVRHTHIKDVIGRDAVVLGEGEVDILGCLKVLKEAGYTGVLSYETEGMQDPEESQTMIVASRTYLKEALQE